MEILAVCLRNVRLQHEIKSTFRFSVGMITVVANGMIPWRRNPHVNVFGRIALKAILTGTVSELSLAADSVSRTFRVKVDLTAQPGLSSGQFARLLVPVGASDSLRVPAAAVVQRGQLEIVFVVANQHAQLHLVKTGKRVGDEVDILSGLHAGDAVVIEGAAQLTDGQPVEAR